MSCSAKHFMILPDSLQRHFVDLGFRVPKSVTTKAPYDLGFRVLKSVTTRAPCDLGFRVPKSVTTTAPCDLGFRVLMSVTTRAPCHLGSQSLCQQGHPVTYIRILGPQVCDNEGTL